MSVSTRRSELLKARLDRFSRVLHGVEKGDIRALHRARVASRRLRELLPVLQLDHGTAHKLNRRLRRVTARLGTVRELDVLLLLIDELHISRRSRSAAIGRVGVAISKARDDARKRLFRHLPMGGLRRIARKLDKLVDELANQEDVEPRRSAAAGAQPRRRADGAKSGWRWAIEARATKRASRLRAAIDEAGAVYLPERLHDVRIAVKKLRYAVELAGDAAGVKRELDLRVLTRGQEILGRMHDLQMLIDRVRDVQASLAPPSLAVWRDLDEVVESLDEDCRRLHARYMRARGALLMLVDRIARGQGPQKLTPTRGQPAAGARRSLTSTNGTSTRRVS
jgi:CHAD domain-containing protein